MSSWIDKIAAIDAVQATGTKQPTKSATAIGGAFPGITSDGGDVLVAAAGPVLSGHAVATFIAGFLAPAEVGSSAKMLWEYSTAFTGASGTAAGYIDDSATGRINGGVRGTAGTGGTQRYSSDAHSTFAVWSWVVDLSIAGAGAIVAIRKNGVAQALTSTTSNSTAGTFGSHSMHFFGRGATPTLGIVATMGHFVVLPSAANPGAPTNAERYVAAQVGLVI